MSTRARNLQIFYLPLFSLVLVGSAVAAVGRTIPPRASLIQTSFGTGLFTVDTSRFLIGLLLLLTAIWAIQAATDRPGAPSLIAQQAYYIAMAILYLVVYLVVGSWGRPTSQTGLPVWTLVGVLPAAAAGALIPIRLERLRARREPGLWAIDDTAPPSLPLAPTERAVWIGTKRAWGYHFNVYVAPVLASAWILYLI
ncbi:MAG: hypothetical protein M3345_08055, partial [Actinomycetota bacterium]|nr:hypothetical protein [Actinomycetota bacterium]